MWDVNKMIVHRLLRVKICTRLSLIREGVCDFFSKCSGFPVESFPLIENQLFWASSVWAIPPRDHLQRGSAWQIQEQCLRSGWFLSISCAHQIFTHVFSGLEKNNWNIPSIFYYLAREYISPNNKPLPHSKRCNEIFKTNFSINVFRITTDGAKGRTIR